jgi:hypothetical protein
MRHDLEDREWPEPDDHDDDDDLTESCPFCDEPVYDDAERCPSCGNYLSREDSPRSRPTWVIVGFLLCFAVALLWILG